MNILTSKFTYLFFICFLLCTTAVWAQPRVIQNVGNRVKGLGNSSNSGKPDSLKHRNANEDSITISFRYLDDTRNNKLDSSIGDFTKRFPIPATSIYLGNTGNASRSILFSPRITPGFDPGFHSFDIYKWKMEQVRFFNTTRPYTEINYLLGSKVEQVIELVQTQNIKPNWNFLMQYRLINSPGNYQNQKTNHNNYLLSSWYHSVNKRYNNYIVLLGNSLQSSENGGVVDTTKVPYKDRFQVPVHIGGENGFSTNFFSNKIQTGNKYNETTALLRQQYDFGKKDSIVTDSTVIPLFFPRIRFEHSLQYEKKSYNFLDMFADSIYYKKFYDTSLRKRLDTFIVKDKWKILSNDFSIYQFPDAKNLQQFIKLGLTLQHISGEFASGKKVFVNTIGHAEYRNKTRNQLWNIEANGNLFFTGFNAGDFGLHISLQRLLGKKIGYLQVGFENANSSTAFRFDKRSSFYLMKTPASFKKENNTHLFAAYFLPAFKLRLTGHYYLSTNYSYITNYYKLKQESTLFNVLQITLEKTIKLAKRWNWHTEIYTQQVIGSAPVQVPALFTRNRIAYEGNLGFKNLDIAFGIETRYHTPYKADSYSAILGQFFYQDSIKIKKELPEVSAYMHFRIKPFKAFVRAENLNTTVGNTSDSYFTRKNLIAIGYPSSGLQIRVGVYWSFVN